MDEDDNYDDEGEDYDRPDAAAGEGPGAPGDPAGEVSEGEGGDEEDGDREEDGDGEEEADAGADGGDGPAAMEAEGPGAGEQEPGPGKFKPFSDMFFGDLEKVYRDKVFVRVDKSATRREKRAKALEEAKKRVPVDDEDAFTYVPDKQRGYLKELVRKGQRRGDTYRAPKDKPNEGRKPAKPPAAEGPSAPGQARAVGDPRLARLYAHSLENWEDDIVWEAETPPLPPPKALPHAALATLEGLGPAVPPKKGKKQKKGEGVEEIIPIAVDEDARPKNVEAGEMVHDPGKNSLSSKLVAPKRLLKWRNPELIGDGWMDSVLWNGAPDGEAAPKPEAPYFTLNDPHMVFEAPPARKKSEKLLLEQAASLFIKAPARKPGARAGSEDDVDNLLMKFNIGKDEHYVKKVQRKGKDTGAVKHAAPALTHSTAPFTDLMADAYFLQFHRHRGQLVARPGLQGIHLRSGPQATLTITVKTLNGATGILTDVDARKTLPDIWKLVVTHLKKTFGTLAGETPQFVLGGPAEGAVAPLSVMGSSLLEAGFQADNLLWAITTCITPIPSYVSQKVPALFGEKPVRPPGAFKKAKELTLRSHHVYLFEYLEEFPLLLSNPGMGTRLVTYYRKTSKADTASKDLPKKLKKEALDKGILYAPMGNVGQVKALNESDDSPLLGPLEKGEHQLVVDNNLFRSAAAVHAAGSGDFLLIRRGNGKWELREVSAVVTVGQQEPHVKVPVPVSVTMRTYEEKRFVDYVHRELRRRIARETKAAGQPIDHSTVTVSMGELKDKFPHTSEQLMRNRLREKCGCEPKTGKGGIGAGEGRWGLRFDARIPEEAELRQRLPPEMVCGYESMRAGELRLRQLGLRRFEKLMGQSRERLKLARKLLPPRGRTEEEMKELGAYIHHLLQLTSWNLTQSFHEVVRDGRGTFMLSGVGDPSGRGRGVSYIKAHVKESAKGSKQATIKTKAGIKMPTSGNIAGTNSDLRSLSMEQARQFLLKLGATDAEIKPLTRWNRIDLLKRLAGAAANDGGELGLAFGRFGRLQRTTATDTQLQYLKKTADIHTRQLTVLTEEWEEEADAAKAAQKAKEDQAEEDQDSDAELENELEGFLEGDSDGEKEVDMADDAEELRRLQDEGLFGETAAEAEERARRRAARRAKKLKKKPKKPTQPQRRLRRVFSRPNPDGSVSTREVVFTDMGEIEAMRMLRVSQAGEVAGTAAAGEATAGAKSVQEKKLAQKNRRRQQEKQRRLKKQIANKAREINRLQKEEEEAAALGIVREPSPGPVAAVAGTKISLNLSTLAKAGAKRKGEGKAKAPKRSRPGGGKGKVNKLNAILKKVLTKVSKEKGMKEFVKPVDLSMIVDYGDYVEEPICLEDVAYSVKRNLYGTWQEFLADVERIMANAKVYNQPGKGVYAQPAVAHNAQIMFHRVKQVLALHYRELEEEKGGKDEELRGLRNGPKAVLNWICCEACGKWRAVSFPLPGEGAVWTCSMNGDKKGASCSDPAELDGEEEADGGAAAAEGAVPAEPVKPEMKPRRS